MRPATPPPTDLELEAALATAIVALETLFLHRHGCALEGSVIREQTTGLALDGWSREIVQSHAVLERTLEDFLALREAAEARGTTVAMRSEPYDAFACDCSDPKCTEHLDLSESCPACGLPDTVVRARVPRILTHRDIKPAGGWPTHPDPQVVQCFHCNHEWKQARKATS
jgi:hypothetical protein